MKFELSTEDYTVVTQSLMASIQRKRELLEEVREGLDSLMPSSSLVRVVDDLEQELKDLRRVLSLLAVQP